MYNRQLVERGDITIYLDRAIMNREEELRKINEDKVGRPFIYPNGLILAGFALKTLFRIAYRQVSGFVEGILKIMNVFRSPNFRTFWRRVRKIDKNLIPYRPYGIRPREKIEIAIDSTGIKTVNDGEYRTMRYDKRKSWVKFHAVVDTRTGGVLTWKVTKDEIRDCEVYKKLIDPLRLSVSKVYGDAAYDSRHNFEHGMRNGYEVCIPVRINSQLGTSRRARNDAIRDQFGYPKGFFNDIFLRNDTRERRRYYQKIWKEKSGYGRRWIDETAFSRFKRMFGEYVFSKKRDMVEKEMRMKVSIYNSTLFI